MCDVCHIFDLLLHRTDIYIFKKYLHNCYVIISKENNLMYPCSPNKISISLSLEYILLNFRDRFRLIIQFISCHKLLKCNKSDKHKIISNFIDLIDYFSIFVLSINQCNYNEILKEIILHPLIIIRLCNVVSRFRICRGICNRFMKIFAPIGCSSFLSAYHKSDSLTIRSCFEVFPFF